MKIKKANGKSEVRINQKEWKAIGRQAGWDNGIADDWNEDQRSLEQNFDSWVASTYGPPGTVITEDQMWELKKKADEMGISDWLNVAPTDNPNQPHTYLIGV